MNTFPGAALWRGTAASWVNLHDFLPGGLANWRESAATGVYHDGTTTIVVGHAFNRVANRREAVMWVSPPPGPRCGLGTSTGTATSERIRTLRRFSAS